MAVGTSKNTLTSIQDNQIHQSAMQQFCNSFSVSVLTIKYCVDLAIPQISVEIYLAGVKIGGGTINPNNPSITIGGGALGFKAEVTLTADFTKNQVTYKITLCAPFVGCTDYSGILFSW
jgi:hypothetical protein